MTARNILYVGDPTVALQPVATSGYTHLVLSQCHIEQNPALQAFRIINGPVSSISPLFRASEFSQWIDPLNDGTFPPSLRAASQSAFAQAGQPLSDDVTVTVNQAGLDWTLTDNVAATSFPMQVDARGTFISFNGAPLAVITDASTYGPYETSLNNGELPAALQQAAGLQGPASDYTVTQQPAQASGRPQWLITNTTSGFTWYVGMGSHTQPDVMVVHDYQAFGSANLDTFMASLHPVIAAGIPILVSLGGWADPTTWAIMGADTQQALVVVAELMAGLGQSGVDYDWEGGPASDMDAIARFTQGLQAALPDVTVTLCPYASTISQLVGVWAQVGLDAIAWANCMNYSPDNDPTSDVTSTFLKPIADAFPGVLSSASDAAPYVVIGFTATPFANDPDGFARLFYDVVHGPPAYPGLGGGFTFALDLDVPDLGTTLQTWASAVAGALAGTAPPAAVA